MATDKYPKTIAPLGDALKDKNWVVRATAAQALAERNSKASIPKVASLLESDTGHAHPLTAYVAVRV
jgi:HEAT repeat protein